MHIGCTQIVVVVMMLAVGVPMAMMVVVVAVAQQPGADEVDAEAQHRHRDRLAIGNRDRVNQPHRAFIGDLDRDQAEDDRAGKGGEVAELAGAEAEMGIARMLAREQIGDGGDPQRGRMGGHVPAIGQQRHRSEKRSCRDLADHHDHGQRDHEPSAALVTGVLRTEKHVIVGPLVERV